LKQNKLILKIRIEQFANVDGHYVTIKPPSDLWDVDGCGIVTEVITSPRLPLPFVEGSESAIFVLIAQLILRVSADELPNCFDHERFVS
jgi:hypothetical protein